MPEVVAPVPLDEAALSALFRRFNRRYFQGELQMSPGFQLRFSRSEKLSGCFRFCRSSHRDLGIDIARRLADHPRALRSTLVHEMLHMLAHQRYRLSGDRYYLDRKPLPGKPFAGPGHGAFFLRHMALLNRIYPELKLSVLAFWGDSLHDQAKIAPVRLLVVNFVSKSRQKGMIYRLHADAQLDWAALSETAMELHGSANIAVLEVAGGVGESFPTLRRDNRPRRNMQRRSLKRFRPLLADIYRHPDTKVIRPELVEAA